MVSLELVLCIFTITLFVANELDVCLFLFVCSLVVILCRQYIQRRTSEPLSGLLHDDYDAAQSS